MAIWSVSFLNRNKSNSAVKRRTKNCRRRNKKSKNERKKKTLVGNDQQRIIMWLYPMWQYQAYSMHRVEMDTDAAKKKLFTSLLPTLDVNIFLDVSTIFCANTFLFWNVIQRCCCLSVLAPRETKTLRIQKNEYFSAVDWPTWSLPIIQRNGILLCRS